MNPLQPADKIRSRTDPGKTAACLLLFSIAFGLKYHYSHATSDDLIWVLKPTATLVMHLGDLSFDYESHTGFISRAGGVIIAPACAGINFMIVALLMAGCSGIFRLKTGWRIPVWIGLAGVSVYGLTVIVNALRIIGAIYLYSADVSQAGIYPGWLTPARIHRLEGVGVYFLALCLFHRATQYLLTIFTLRTSMSETKAQSNQRPFYGWTPAAWYFLVLIGIPLIHRTAARNPARFLEHGLTVIMGSALVLFVFFLIRSVMGSRRRTALSTIKKTPDVGPLSTGKRENRQ